MAKRFNDAGYLPSRASKWTPDNVAKMRSKIGKTRPTASKIAGLAPAPDPLFTPDDHITEAGLRKFLDALRCLRANEAQVQNFSNLRQAALSARQKDNIRTKIDQAKQKREQEELEKVVSELLDKENLGETMFFWQTVRIAMR